MVKAINIYTNEVIEVMPSPPHIKMMWHKNEYCKKIEDLETLVLTRVEYSKNILTKEKTPGSHEYYEINDTLYVSEDYCCSINQTTQFKGDQLSLF